MFYLPTVNFYTKGRKGEVLPRSIQTKSFNNKNSIEKKAKGGSVLAPPYIFLKLRIEYFFQEPFGRFSSFLFSNFKRAH